jgi:hypothetical protein
VTIVLPALTPIDPYERREQWRFAVLLLALVASQGGRVTTDGSVVGPAAPTTSRAVARKTRRMVRPPRSC